MLGQNTVEEKRPVTDFNALLLKLNKSLGVLQERAAKYAGNAPPELLNQIDDHKQAITLTEQARQGKISEAEWREQLKPLLVSVPEARVIFDQRGQTVGAQYNIAGDLIYQEAPPSQTIDPATLAAAEQRYREHLKARYAEDAPYYIPLAGETTEAVPRQTGPQALRSARRRRQRAVAEYHEWIQAEQEIRRVKLNTLREGVDKYACIILLGDPGSGKTTALENLAYQFADEPDRLPIPLRLSEFGSGMTLEDFIFQSWAGSLEANHWGAPEVASNLAGYLTEGKLFFLFDALNEMPREGYQERARALRHFIDTWSSNNRFLVTCRVLDYGDELSGLQRIEVQPLNDDQIKAFLQNELVGDWELLWQALAESGDGQHRLLEMARNPYLLTIMIDIFVEDGQLGRNRAELMSQFTQILLGWAKTKYDPEEWLDVEVQVEALAALAFKMQSRAGSGAAVETDLVKTLLPSEVPVTSNLAAVPVPPDRILTLAAGANIIEMPVDRSSVRFYHQLLQEYFSARTMLKRRPGDLTDLWRWPWLETAECLPLRWRIKSLVNRWRKPWEKEMPLWVRPEDSWDPLLPPPPTGWEETTILAAGLTAENDDHLVRALIEVNPVLAGRCLYEGQAKVDKRVRQAVIKALLTTMARPEVALRVRIAAGETLGYLGDPRLGELVTVSAGEFLMGDDKYYEKNEKPQHTLSLPAYRIGKYPVTNVEYGRFIQARGYQDKRWWTEAGWQWKGNTVEPGFWQDSRFNKPNQPVVGVSWYESLAYCRWLSAETGQVYRLPTEAEWEKAARGRDGRQYPWGNKFEANRLNAYEGEQTVLATTPVGIYSEGISPYGVLDMAGNVWEWTSSLWGKDLLEPAFKYPYDPADGRENLAAGDEILRGLRGGSWDSRQFNARCACRLRDDPHDRNGDIGFRVLVSPSSPPSAL